MKCLEATQLKFAFVCGLRCLFVETRSSGETRASAFQLVETYLEFSFMLALRTYIFTFHTETVHMFSEG